MVFKVWGEGGNEELFNRYRVSLWEDENVLEMDSGDGSTVWMPLICRLEKVSFMIYIFYRNNKMKKQLKLKFRNKIFEQR